MIVDRVPFRNGEPERSGPVRRAGAAAEHIRRCAGTDPAGADDAARAAADTLHVAAAALRNPVLRRAADDCDRAARAPYGQIPPRTREGSQLRDAARLLALTGRVASDSTLVVVALAANLAALAMAVAELRLAQQRAAQAAAARAAAGHLHAAAGQARSRAAGFGPARGPWRARPGAAADLARADVSAASHSGGPAAGGPGRARPRPRRGPLPPGRGPGR